MRLKTYHVNLYVIVPLVFSCLALLAMVVTYRLTLYCIGEGIDLGLMLIYVGVAVFGVTYSVGLLISHIMLNPLDQFVKYAEEHPAVRSVEQGEHISARDQIQRYSTVLHQVTDLLSKVDAREMFPSIITQSRAMRSVLSQILKVAPTDSTVLITGESGTGKELVATAIREHSKRKNGPFIAVNCAAIPQGLLESELFGHEKGAFTGAVNRKKGKFELADKGTLFLDEIGDMPMETQAKILRALESGVCERVGGSEPIAFDVRVIAATNKDFAVMIGNGEFREDLYHRLNVFPIQLPPLRERREDISLLAEHFLARHDPGLTISQPAMQLLFTYSWKGNVREMRNVLERAALLADGDTIEARHLTLNVDPEDDLRVEELGEVNLDEKMSELEQAYIVSALVKTKGIQIRAAEMLGIKERSLWHRIKKYGIDVTTFKD